MGHNGEHLSLVMEVSRSREREGGRETERAGGRERERDRESAK